MALKRHKLLALDTDAATLKDIAEITSPHFDVIRVRDAARAVAILDVDHDVRVFMGEPVPYEPTGTSILSVLKTRHPHVQRVMLTTYGDLTAIVTGLHEGTIQHLLRKPITRSELAALSSSLATQLASVPVPASPIQSQTRLTA